jgi:Flp pilus assembly protein TadG
MGAGSSIDPVRSGPARRRRGRAGGQSLVEFALVLTPMFLLILGVIQFGFVFNSFVTITNAAREAARDGSIYVFDRTLTKDQNDLARNEQIKDSLLASMNLLGKTAPQFATGSTWTKSGLTFTNGDLQIAYVIPGTVTDSDTRMGQRITVRATYHLDLIVPIASNFLPKDAGGRLPLIGEVTMVVN